MTTYKEKCSLTLSPVSLPSRILHNIPAKLIGSFCVQLTIPLELFIPFILILVTNLTVGGASGYLGPHSTFKLYILFS